MRKIIAVDFDNTLAVSNNYPEIGDAIESTIEKLLTEHRLGAYIILWTCRSGQHLASALEWCLFHEVPIDGVNCNAPEALRVYGHLSDSRKIYAHEYWDDKAVRITIP